MLLNLPTSKSTIKYVVILLVLILIAIFYFLFTRFSSSKEVNMSLNNQNGTVSNEAFFIPPSSSDRQIEVTGKVVKIDSDEKAGATHKIIDPADGSVLIYATTNDDKLNQQEGNIVKLVGSVPINEEVSQNTLLKVDYISFK